MKTKTGIEAKPVIEYFHGIYRQDADGIRLVALMRNEQDAKDWHANPGLFFNCRRRVKLSPAPIEVMDPVPAEEVAKAFELLDLLVNDSPDEKLGEVIVQAKELLEKRKRK